MKKCSLPFGLPLSPLLCILYLPQASTKPPPSAEIPAQPQRAMFSQHQRDNSLKETFLLNLVRGHYDPSLCTYRSGVCKLSIVCHPTYSPLSQKNLCNCALTSNGCDSSWSFLRGCSWIIILNLAQIKFSITFLDGLITFCSQ